MLQHNANQKLLSGLEAPPPIDDLLPPSSQSHQLPEETSDQGKFSVKHNENHNQNPEKAEMSHKKIQRSRLSYILKTINIIIGIIFVVFAIFCYSSVLDVNVFNGSAQILIHVMPAYIGLSGLILLIVECRMMLMLQHMSFLYHYMGRGFFNIYAGIMPLMLIADIHQIKVFEVLAMITSALTISVGLMYIIMKICCCEREEDRIDELNNRINVEDRDQD